MQIVEKDVGELQEYENNPRNNDNAVDAVAHSIKDFGFRVPVVIDKNNIIIAGHTRVKAAKQLGLKLVPCIIADDLTEEQIKAFRLADNKTSEISEWDFDKLDIELTSLQEAGFDMGIFGFADTKHIEWADIPELTEESYEEPIKKRLVCPKCGHTADASFFKKA